jgi:hypothetical protein
MERDAIASTRVIGSSELGFRNLDWERENDRTTGGGTSDSTKEGLEESSDGK